MDPLGVATVLTTENDPIAIVALAFAIFLFAPLLLRKLGAPGIVGIIILGIVVGPYVLGLIEPDPTIVLLGQVGIVFLVFVAGLDINVNEFLEHPTRSLASGAICFVLPATIFVLIGIVYLGYGLSAALLFSAMYSSPTLLAYPVVEKLGLGKNRAISTIVSTTMVTNTLAFLVLAVVGASTTSTVSSPLSWAVFALGVILVFATIWFAFPRISRWFLKRLHGEGYSEFLLIMVVLFSAALLATLAGMSSIIGAFVCGLAINRVVPAGSTLMNRVKFVGNAIFIPFFLLYVGLLIDPDALFSGTDVWVLTALIVVSLVATELAAAFIIGRVYKFSRPEWMTMFALSIGQAAAALAIAIIGTGLGLFGGVILYSVVIVILIVGLLSPILVQRFGQQLVRQKERELKEVGSHRMLVAIDRFDERGQMLMDLALEMRQPKSGEKVFVVVPVERSFSPAVNEANLSDAEKALADAKEHAVSAEVTVEVASQLDVTRVAAIARMAENDRADEVYAAPPFRSYIGEAVFGNDIAQLLDQSKAQLVMVDISRPVNTSKRIVVVLSSGLFLNEGFERALSDIKLLALNTGLPLEFELIKGDEGIFGSVISRVKPEVPFEIHSHSSWRPTLRANAAVMRKDDLVILVGTRRGAKGWSVDVGSVARVIDGEQPTAVVLLYLEEH